MANIKTIYGKRYDLDNPQDVAEVLRIQKQAQLKTVQKALSPNRIISPEARLNASNELASLNAIQNATTNPVAPPTAGGLLNLPPAPDANLQLNQQTQGLLNTKPVIPKASDLQKQMLNNPQLQTAMKQVYKPTLGQRAKGLFNTLADNSEKALPILAVANEFTKAGALRPIGGEIQGDPYGKMMEIAQTNKENENLTQLRSQYPQYSNLPNEQFLNVIESLAEDGKLNVGNQLQQTKEQRDANQLKNIKNSMQTGDADAALSYGAFDRLGGGISSISGKFGLPIKKYQTANTATEGFIRDAMNASRANFDGRQTNLLFEFIKEEMPEPNMNEQQALERTKTVYRRFADAINGYEQLLDEPNSDLTTSQRGNISKTLKLYEGVRDRSLVRIKSIEDVISSSKLEKASGDSVYEAPDVNDTNLDTSEINEWNNSLSIREQIQ